MSKRIAVIGTGLSGASCANRLRKTHNCSVKLFEKSRGTGGRMATRRGIRDFDGAAFQCDHGAQYFTAQSSIFQAQVQEWASAGVVCMWDAKPSVYDGSDWKVSASDDINRWCGTPSMKAPIRHLLEDADMELNSTIDEISKNPGEKWQLHSLERGWQQEEYDAVVFAVPAPQATPLVAPHSTKLSDISNSAHMKGAWAIMLQYKLPLDVPFDSAFINHGPLSWISRDSAKPGRDKSVETWLLHATSDWSEENIDKTSDKVAAELIAAFCTLKLPSDFQIQPPHAWSTHRWLFATTHPNLAIQSAWDEEAKVGLCGDWLHMGMIEGAWLSGRHLADAMHGSLRSPTDSESNSGSQPVTNQLPLQTISKL